MMNEHGRGAEQLFPDNHDGLTTAEATARLHKYGRNEVPNTTTPGWRLLLQSLWSPMSIALWIAIMIEMYFLHHWVTSAILAVVQFGHAIFKSYRTAKTRGAVRTPHVFGPRAVVFRDGAWQDLDASLVVPGDKVKLASGSAIPADSTINDGPDAQIDVDEAALTGESLPVTMLPKQHLAKMGSTVVRGEVDGTVQATGSNTVIGKTALLLQAPEEADVGGGRSVLNKIGVALPGLSLFLCVICFIWLMAYHDTSFKTALEFVAVLLVVSVPIAAEVVVAATVDLGSAELSASKVIVTRTSAIEKMAAVNMLIADKTGTLTLNKMEIQESCPVFSDDDDRESVLVLAALTTKWREPPRDALDTMLLGAANLDRCDAYKQVDYKPFDPRVKRTEATLIGPDGVQFMVTKGAPNIVLSLCANKDEIQSRVEGILSDLSDRGVRCLSIARTREDGAWYMAGILTFLDPPRPDTASAVAKSREFGIDVKMVTGDHLIIAKEMARMIDLGTTIGAADDLPRFPPSGDPDDVVETLGVEYGDQIAATDGYAQVYPEHKYIIAETLCQRGFTCAMTGDGVGDAPTLKRADIGIAVHGATDAARDASDMVVTEPGLSVIVDAMLIARGVFQRMLSFLTYRVSATLQLVFFFFIAVFALPPKHYGVVEKDDPKQADFFELPMVMFLLMTLLNDGALIAIGYDRTLPQPRPQRWNLLAQLVIAAVLASVACVSSLLLLWMALDADRSHESSWFRALGLPAVEYPQIVTMMFLKTTISDFLTFCAARTQNKPFFAHRPSLIFVVCAVVSLSLSTLAATFWPEISLHGIKTKGLWYGEGHMQKIMPLFVWAYCLLWWFIQDAVKVLTYFIMEKTNLFGCRTSQETGRPTCTATAALQEDGLGLRLL